MPTRKEAQAMTTSGKLPIPSMKERCSAPEWHARVDLAACYRLVDLYGMSDMMANHISSHVPGEPGAFLINAYGMMYEEITASSLIKVDRGGAILSTPDFGDLGYGINKAATSSTAPSMPRGPTSPASSTRTAGRRWRCRRSNAACCR
jgi:hypothetical protein